MSNVLTQCRTALNGLDSDRIDETVEFLRRAKRIFCVGNGGGYAHAMHFASDLRKIAGKQAFSFDNMAEITARINDQGWAHAWRDWYRSHGQRKGDLLFLFSVGGALTADVSANLNVMQPEWGIVGLDGAFADRIVIPSTSTPVVEGCQSVIAHHIVEQLAQ